MNKNNNKKENIFEIIGLRVYITEKKLVNEKPKLVEKILVSQNVCITVKNIEQFKDKVICIFQKNRIEKVNIVIRYAEN